MKTVHAVHVYIYGHYDSRGGAVAVIANTKDEADLWYVRSFGMDDVVSTDFNDDAKASMRACDVAVRTLLGYNDAQALLSSDYLFEADLQLEDVVPTGYDLLHGYNDLPWAGEIYERMNPAYPLPPLPQIVDDYEWYTDTEGALLIHGRRQMRLVPARSIPMTQGDQVQGDEDMPAFVPLNGCWWRKTSLGEDACGVILVDAKGGQ